MADSVICAFGRLHDALCCSSHTIKNINTKLLLTPGGTDKSSTNGHSTEHYRTYYFRSLTLTVFSCVYLSNAYHYCSSP